MEPALPFVPAMLSFLRYDPRPGPTNLAERLTTVRHARGLSRELAAQQMHVDPATLHRGKPACGSPAAGSSNRCRPGLHPEPSAPASCRALSLKAGATPPADRYACPRHPRRRRAHGRVSPTQAPAGSFPGSQPRMPTQRDVMRQLYRQHRGNQALVIRAYAKAEVDGQVGRRSDRNQTPPIAYAHALWVDGIKKGWLPPSAARPDDAIPAASGSAAPRASVVPARHRAVRPAAATPRHPRWNTMRTALWRKLSRIFGRGMRAEDIEAR